VTIDVDPLLAPRTLVEPDVSKLPGARFVAGLAIFDEGIDLSGGCVRAPSDRFVPGIESVLFERATSLALRASALTPTELATTKSSSDPSGLYTRTLEGRTAEKSIGIAHVLTFAGSDRDALLCTLVCSSPTDRGNSDCTETLASLRIVGAHAPPPDPSLLARTLFLAADHPKPALASLAVVTALIIVWVLARRPRPRP
jgi:hypothetical protein